MDNFGIFMKDMRLKVTSGPRQTPKMTILPCQMGFNDNGTWYNVWVSVLVTSRTNAQIVANRGDIIKVSGRMDYKEYQSKPQWSVWADSVEPYGQQVREPFNGGNNGNMDDMPF